MTTQRAAALQNACPHRGIRLLSLVQSHCVLADEGFAMSDSKNGGMTGRHLSRGAPHTITVALLLIQASLTHNSISSAWHLDMCSNTI